MPFYTYKAKDAKGKEVIGKVQAENEESLAERLSKTGYFIVEIHLEKTAVMQQDIFEMFRGISSREYILFLTHFYVALDAGISILKILETLLEQVQSKKFALALEDVRAEVVAGTAFSMAIKKHPKIFPSYFSSMISVGETTGKVSESIKQIAGLIEKDQEFKQKISSVMIYPIILMVVTTGVITFLMTYIMPKFITIFQSAKVDLPLPTQILVFISNSLRSYWYYLLGAITAIIITVKMYIMTKQGRFALDTLKLKLPLFGKLYQQIYVARFMGTLSTLYNSGISIDKALELVEEDIGNMVFAQTIKKLRVEVEAGRGIADVLGVSNLFSADSLMMIASGEETGKLSVMLKKTADLYEKDTDYFLKTVASVMEPMIILIMGGVVGFVALGILLPVFRLSTAVH